MEDPIEEAVYVEALGKVKEYFRNLVRLTVTVPKELREFTAGEFWGAKEVLEQLGYGDFVDETLAELAGDQGEQNLHTLERKLRRAVRRARG